MKLGDTPIENIPFIPSGSIGLDAALESADCPGTCHEIYGRSQRENNPGFARYSGSPETGGIAAFIDAEHAFDSFMRKMGIDIENCWYLSQTMANRRWKSWIT